MVSRFYGLPSLTALAVFEASARHLSFKLAAGELNVTPSAISKQIKTIEEEVGAPLFIRNGQGVALTQAGEALYGVLARGFSRVSDLVRTLKHGDQANSVTIVCPDTFETMWLIARMPDFWRRYPGIAVDHVISDSPKDYRRADVNLRIRYGLGAWQDETAELLFDDVIYPVCGLGFAALHNGVTARQLPQMPLLHVDWVGPDWLGWEELMQRAGIPHGLNNGRRFSKLSVAMQAAMADQGVAIGWDRLARPLINDGKLVRFTDLVIPAPGAYYMTTNNHRVLSPATCVLRDWLREMAQKERNITPGNMIPAAGKL